MPNPANADMQSLPKDKAGNHIRVGGGQIESERSG